MSDGAPWRWTSGNDPQEGEDLRSACKKFWLPGCLELNEHSAYVSLYTSDCITDQENASGRWLCLLEGSSGEFRRWARNWRLRSNRT